MNIVRTFVIFMDFLSLICFQGLYSNFTTYQLPNNLNIKQQKIFQTDKGPVNCKSVTISHQHVVFWCCAGQNRDTVYHQQIFFFTKVMIRSSYFCLSLKDGVVNLQVLTYQFVNKMILSRTYFKIFSPKKELKHILSFKNLFLV